MDPRNPWQQAYCGSACVALQDLRPIRIIARERSLNFAKIRGLTEIFRIGGCRREFWRNRIKCVVTRDLWHHLEPLVRQYDGQILRLPEGEKLAYVHGRHRLAAAQSLLPAERWWVVDFYQRELITSEVLSMAIDDFDNNTPFSDGTVFRNLRLSAQGSAEYTRWMARLSRSKRRDLAQLWRQTQMQPLSVALDSLLNGEGLFQRFTIGTFHRLLTMRCTEELVTYINWIRCVWSYLVTGNESGPMPYLDAMTVQQLEGRSPKISAADQRYINELFSNGYLFTWITPIEKQLIHERVRTWRTVIPSLHTFLEDTKLLEPAGKSIRELFSCSRQTIRAALSRNYRGEAQNFSRAYRQVWLCALRHYHEITSYQPRKNKRSRSIPLVRLTRAEALLQLAAEAKDVGFITKHSIGETGPFREQPSSNIAPVATNRHCEFRLLDRCGRVYEEAFSQTLPFMFHEHIYRVQGDVTNTNVSAFSIFRDIFQAFFGYKTDDVLRPFDDFADMDVTQDSTLMDALVQMEARGEYMPSRTDPSFTFQQETGHTGLSTNVAPDDNIDEDTASELAPAVIPTETRYQQESNGDTQMTLGPERLLAAQDAPPQNVEETPSQILIVPKGSFEADLRTKLQNIGASMQYAENLEQLYQLCCNVGTDGALILRDMYSSIALVRCRKVMEPIRKIFPPNLYNFSAVKVKRDRFTFHTYGSTIKWPGSGVLLGVTSKAIRFESVLK